MPPKRHRRGISRSSTPLTTRSVKRTNPFERSRETENQRHLKPLLVSSSQISSDRWTPAGTPVPTPSRLGRDGTQRVLPMEHNDDDEEHVILAFNGTRRHTLGCSYYVAQLGVLYCMEDFENADAEVLNSREQSRQFLSPSKSNKRAVKADVQPTIILVSPHVRESLGDELSRQGSVDISDNEEPTLPYLVKLRPYTDFKYEKAVQKLSLLASLKDRMGVRFLVPSEDEHNDDNAFSEEIDLTDARGRILHVSSSINLDSRISIGCAGAIISYLQGREFQHDDQARHNLYQINGLEMFSLKDTMCVERLQQGTIIQPEAHPNAAKQGPGSSGAKESLSVFGLFSHFARTPQGKQKLRTLFLHPTLDVCVIEERQNAIAVFSRTENQTVLKQTSKSLAKIKNLKRVMVALHKGIEGGGTSIGCIRSGVWSSLLDFCFHVIDLWELLNEFIGVDRLCIYRQAAKTFDRREFKRLGKAMFDIIDLDESQQQHRTVIKPGIHDDLDRIKNAFNGMDEILQQAAIETVPELQLGREVAVPELHVMYIPQLGFHVRLPIDAAANLISQTTNPEWERMFTTEENAFYKTVKMRKMDNEIGDMWGIICDIEIEISHELAQRVLEREHFLTAASDTCGELDTLLALAHGAVEYRLKKPKFVHENLIDICGGRHLIQELISPSYVPNDALLLGGSSKREESPNRGASVHPSLLLLTGPNYSGKSVYLKQVALIVYMAQVGSFIPASSARLGITDKIITRITSRETVSRGQSSFMIDLQQVSRALKACTPQSLLVIDEFGKGTDTCDGAGLAAGVLTHLLSLKEQAPKVLASTHFHEIFEQDLMSEDMPGLGLRQMEVYLKREKKEPVSDGALVEEATYLYNVRPGRSTLSYGAQCAEMNGVPREIVTRACELSNLAVAGEDLVFACSYIPDDELADLEEAEQICREFFQLDLDAVGFTESTRFKTVLTNLIERNPRV